MRIERKVDVVPLDEWGPEGPQNAPARIGDNQPRHAPQERQQRALRQHLPHEPRPARAKRGSQSHFLFTARSPRQQQIRQIRACNQQH